MTARLPAALLLAMFAATPSAAATRNFGIEGFDRIRVDGPFKVHVKTGVAPFARASGSSAAIDRVSIEVQGRTLIVHLNQSSWGGYPGRSPGPVEISVGTHDLSAAWLNGSGSLEVDRIRGLNFDLSLQGSGSAAIARADVDQLRVTLFGNSSTAIAGRVAKMTAILRGITALDAAALTTKDAAIGAEGAATVKAAVTNAATVNASGTATVALTGNPACTVRANGSASVSGCR